VSCHHDVTGMTVNNMFDAAIAREHYNVAEAGDHIVYRHNGRRIDNNYRLNSYTAFRPHGYRTYQGSKWGWYTCLSGGHAIQESSGGYHPNALFCRYTAYNWIL